MKETIQKSCRYIEKKTACFPKILFYGGVMITILLLLYTLFDLQSTLSSGVFADLEERTGTLCEYALISGLIPMGTAAVMKRMACNTRD